MIQVPYSQDGFQLGGASDLSESINLPFMVIAHLEQPEKVRFRKMLQVTSLSAQWHTFSQMQNGNLEKIRRYCEASSGGVSLLS